MVYLWRILTIFLKQLTDVIGKIRIYHNTRSQNTSTRIGPLSSTQLLITWHSFNIYWTIFQNIWLTIFATKNLSQHLITIHNDQNKTTVKNKWNFFFKNKKGKRKKEPNRMYHKHDLSLPCLKKNNAYITKCLFKWNYCVW